MADCGEMKGRRNHKRKRDLSEGKTVALLFASLLNNNNSPLTLPSNSILISKCLNHIHLSLPQLTTLPFPILSLFPFLLNHRETMSRASEIVGAASLHSLEMNQQIALDDQTVKALVWALKNSDSEETAEAACNAIMDMSTTSTGKQQLIQFSALEALMSKFLQVTKSLTRGYLRIEDHGSVPGFRVGFRENDLSISLLEATIILLNTCCNDKLDNICSKLSDNFMVFLHELWENVHSQMMLGDDIKHNQDMDLYVSNITSTSLAEGIFRLSVKENKVAPLPLEVVRRGIFGLDESSFKTFMLNRWEARPFLTEKLSRSSIEKNDMFHSVAASLNCKKQSTSSFIPSILRNLVSCMPISSDELDILSYLNEVKNELGCPIIYQQDIRVLRTEKLSKKEEHFFCDAKASHVFSINDILKCEEAFKEGYTVSLRGMGFRFNSIASIADGLASLFGQPSVGANLYLTPADSQGLSSHYDDHCVFICQIFGTKKWTVSSKPTVHLPRLYGSIDTVDELEGEHLAAKSEQFLVGVGDVLYIPRGFSHKACTNSAGSSDSEKMSLHLTLGIEIEPPFEWEGFAHVAVCCWKKMHRATRTTCLESLPETLNVMSMNLLHAAIVLLGSRDPTLRKACLVAGTGSCSLEERDVFVHIISKISTESIFVEVHRFMEVALERNEDPFDRIRWLRNLSLEKDDWIVNLGEIVNIFPVYARDKEKAEKLFVQAKSKFCAEVVFEKVIERYKILLEMLRKTRQQYTRGMLALHQCN